MSALEITNTAMICSNGVSEVPVGYLLNLLACSDRWIYTSNRVEQQGWVHLAAVRGQSSAFVPLEFSPVVGTMPGGVETTIDSLLVGRVIIVGTEPLLEGRFGPGGEPTLVVYAEPGSVTRLETTTDLLREDAWTFERRLPAVAEFSQVIRPFAVTNQTVFVRAVRE